GSRPQRHQGRQREGPGAADRVTAAVTPGLAVRVNLLENDARHFSHTQVRTPVADVAYLPVGKREQTKVQNRQAILDAARDVFGEKGYEAATVRDIIRRTGLAAGTFYNYYRSKE